MSLSGGSGRSSSFGKKGYSSAQKKEKKKKQEFHKHKIKFSEQEGSIDFDRLKDRVSVALDKLGSQVFSPEPGGYTFYNWMTSFDLLLDDFEEKTAANYSTKNILPREYYDARVKISEDLLKPIDTSDLDTEIQKIQVEIDSLQLQISEFMQKKVRLANAHGESSSKIYGLEKKREESDEELKEADAELEEEQQKKKRKSFLSKMFHSRSFSADSAQDKVNSIKKRREEIDESIRELEDKASVDDLKEQLVRTREKLAAFEQKMGELQTLKLEREQLTEKRKVATDALSAMISSLKDPEGDQSESVKDIPAVPRESGSS
ncbi:MAG: coiled-coil domain-containing protein [Rhabdochlamydiaceae bacterium]